MTFTGCWVSHILYISHILTLIIPFAQYLTNHPLAYTRSVEHYVRQCTSRAGDRYRILWCRRVWHLPSYVRSVPQMATIDGWGLGHQKETTLGDGHHHHIYFRLDHLLSFVTALQKYPNASRYIESYSLKCSWWQGSLDYDRYSKFLLKSRNTSYSRCLCLSASSLIPRPY